MQFTRHSVRPIRKPVARSGPPQVRRCTNTRAGAYIFIHSGGGIQITHRAHHHHQQPAARGMLAGGGARALRHDDGSRSPGSLVVAVSSVHQPQTVVPAGGGLTSGGSLTR